MKCINLFLRDGSTLPSSGDAASGWPVDAAKAVYSMNYICEWLDNNIEDHMNDIKEQLFKMDPTGDMYYCDRYFMEKRDF